MTTSHRSDDADSPPSRGALPPQAETPQARPQVAPDGPTSGLKGGHGAKTQVIRDRAITALLAGLSIAAAARQAGASERSVKRWLGEDASFQAALAEARRSAFEAALGRLQVLTGRAVAAMEDLLKKTTPPAVRLGAARSVIEVGLHQRDAEMIVRRLDQIEAFQRQRRESRRR